MTPTPLKSALHCLSALAFLSAGIAAAQAPRHQQSGALHAPRVDADFGKLPLSFEPNRGQSDASIQFLARGSQYTVLLQPTAATLVLSRENGVRPAGRPTPVTRAAIRMTLDGANPRAAMSADRPLSGYVNYITGDKSKTYTGIPTYAATRAASVYPGIDLVYYGTGRQLEYDFVVSPKSDPSLIHLAIDGARPVVESNGDLRLQIGATSRDTDIVFHKPVLYQQVDGVRHSIDGAFTVAANNKVGFEIGAYDRSKELVIDPVIGYGSYFGGSGEDEINGSTLDASNELFAAGQTFSPSLPGSTGEFQALGNAGNGGHDAFVTKFSADGSTVLWSTFLEGSQDDFATAVAVNTSNQPYVVGYTNSCQGSGDPGSSSTSVRFPFTSDAIQTLCSPNVIGFDNYESNGGNYTTFLVKLSSDGKTELYGTPIGGSSGEYASSIVLDATGRPYIVGETSSTSYNKCATVGPHCSDIPAYPVDQHGNSDIGLANYPTTSNAFYSNTFEAQTYPTVCIGCPGTQDEQAFITILSADLHTFVYSSLIGGPGIGGCGNGNCNTNGLAVAVNAAGQAFIGGNTSSAHWPTTAGGFAPTCSNAGAANSQCRMTGWLAGFDPSKSGAASLLFSTYITGTSAGTNGGNPLYPGSDVYGIATDSTGNVVAVGDTNANDFPTTAGTFQPTCILSGDGNADNNVCTNAFVTKLSPTGATIWSTYYHGTGSFGAGNSVVGQGVALDANNNVFVVGTSNVASLPLIQPISTNPSQSADAFLIELSPNASSLLAGTYIGTGGGITLNNNSLHLDSAQNAYFSGSQGNNPYGGTYFPVTANAPMKTIGGSTDGWVMKLITQQQISSTALQITPNAGAPGTSIGFTATVTGVPGFATPTGTVTLTNGATTLGTITLANATGTFNTSTLAAGTYSVVATYSGDVVYAGNTTTAQTVTIQNTPTVALTATPSTTTTGTAVALVATVASSAGTPTGTVYFMDGANTLGSAMLVSGVASYSATALAVGSHSITARYSGDSNFVAVNSAAQTVTINLLTPTVALTATPGTAAIGTAIALGATVTGTGASPTGNVKFMDGTTTLATINLASGAASYSATSLAVGTHTITASYSGDSNFAALVSTAQTVTINLITPTVTLTATPATATIGTAIALGATVTGTGASPTGTVKFLDGTTTLATINLASGAAGYSATALAVGTHTITASYSGDANFAASVSAAQTVTINALPPTVNISASPSSITIKSGSTGTSVITVTTANAYAGTLNFSCGTLPANASCKFSPSTLTFSATTAATQTTTITISTSAAATAALNPLPRPGFTGTILAAFLLLPVAFTRRARRVLRVRSLPALLLIVFAVLTTGALSGCAGSSTPAPATTSPGTYTLAITITGAPAGTALNLQVIVQ